MYLSGDCRKNLDECSYMLHSKAGRYRISWQII